MKLIEDFKNKVICGDCLELLKEIPDESIDAIVTDPPYNTGMQKVDLKPNQKAWLSGFFDDNYTDEDYLKLIKGTLKELFRILKNNKGGYIYMNWKKMGLWINELNNVGFNVKNVIVWDKKVHGLNYQNYAYTHEFIIFFTKGKFFPSNKSLEDKRNGYFKDVWNIQRKIENNSKEGHHETEKLLKVVKIPIEHSTNKGDIVIDPFLGSGTTAVACKQLGRNYIGFEISQEYVDMANKRLEQGVLF